MSFGMSSPRNITTLLDLVAGCMPVAKVVDVGCGGGNYGKLLRYNFAGLHIVGIDAFAGNMNPLWDCYDAVIIADARTRELPKADLYLLIDVIEHMPRNDGIALVERIQGDVIVCTPRHWPQKADENPYQEHVSEWHESDFAFTIDRSDAEFVIGLIGRKQQ